MPHITRRLSADLHLRLEPSLLTDLTIKARRDGVTVGELARRALVDDLRRARNEERPRLDPLGAPITSQPSEADRVATER